MTLFLIAGGLLSLWIGSLWVHPFGACPRCRGKRHIMRGTSKKPRPVTCPMCKGVGRRQRPGSRTVHRTVRRVRRELDRQRRQRQAAAAAGEER